jgi:hypothetical protein
MMESDPDIRVRQDIEKLVEQLKPELCKLLRDMSGSELIRLHWGYGMGLRNQFRQGKFPHLFSAVAIREIWLHVRSSRPPQPS